MGLPPFILLQNNTMKKFFVLSLLFCVQFSYAQLFSGDKIINNANFDKQRFSWGYFLGFNTYDFKFDYNDEPQPSGRDLIISKSIGFNVGLLGNLRLNNNLDLRLAPGVNFNTRNFRSPSTREFDEITSTYIHIPLLLKFSADRKNNFKPFIIGGLSTSINLSSGEDNPEEKFSLKTINYNYEIGLGVDLYLYYFKFSPSIRGVFTINDEKNKLSGAELRQVDALRSRAIFINFTFQ
ncbi:probable protein-translocating porin PorT [Salegentibacter echinorum]|uniref:Probable protein-translocating porin PorT n=2 Tax=Salegentibacter echinorum TaxID=1073325 RepID=A0A1M5GIX9_SALEC|nr:probable protein-translocating porin PorT [Salegentibacter echinorum]